MMCANGWLTKIRFSYRKGAGWRLVEVTEAAAAPGAGDDAEEEEPEPCPLEDMGVILSGGVNPLELRQAQKHFSQGAVVG